MIPESTPKVHVRGVDETIDSAGMDSRRAVHDYATVFL